MTINTSPGTRLASKRKMLPRGSGPGEGRHVMSLEELREAARGAKVSEKNSNAHRMQSSARIEVRIEASHKALWTAIAESKGLKLSEWIRFTLERESGIR